MIWKKQNWSDNTLGRPNKVIQRCGMNGRSFLESLARSTKPFGELGEWSYEESFSRIPLPTQHPIEPTAYNLYLYFLSFSVCLRNVQFTSFSLKTENLEFLWYSSAYATPNIPTAASNLYIRAQF